MLRGNTLSRAKASSLTQLPDKPLLCWGLAGFWPTGKSNLKWEPTTKWAGLSCLLNKQKLVKEAGAYASHGADSASKVEWLWPGQLDQDAADVEAQVFVSRIPAAANPAVFLNGMVCRLLCPCCYK